MMVGSSLLVLATLLVKGTDHTNAGAALGIAPGDIDEKVVTADIEQRVPAFKEKKATTKAKPNAKSKDPKKSKDSTGDPPTSKQFITFNLFQPTTGDNCPASTGPVISISLPTQTCIPSTASTSKLLSPVNTAIDGQLSFTVTVYPKSDHCSGKGASTFLVRIPNKTCFQNAPLALTDGDNGFNAIASISETPPDVLPSMSSIYIYATSAECYQSSGTNFLLRYSAVTDTCIAYPKSQQPVNMGNAMDYSIEYTCTGTDDSYTKFKGSLTCDASGSTSVVTENVTSASGLCAVQNSWSTAYGYLYIAC